MLSAPLCLLLLLPAEDQPKPKMPLGRDTTLFNGPLDKDGYIDYEAALNERLGKDITPEKNANVLLWKAFGPRPEGGNGMPTEFFKAMGIEEPPEKGDYLIGIDRFLRDHAKLERVDWDAIFDQQQRATKRPWNSNDFPHIAAWLKINEKPLAVVIEATKRPEYFNPLASSRPNGGPSNLLGCLLPGVQKCREFASLLAARAMLRVNEGKFDEAWQDLLACHRLGRLVGRGATMIESLVGIAINSIASNADLAYLEKAPLTAKQIQDRMRELNALPKIPSAADKIGIGERCMFLDSFQMIRRGGPGMLEGLAGGRPPANADPKVLAAMDSIDWAPALRNANGWYDRLAAASRIDNRAQREKALEALEGELKELKQKTADSIDLTQLFAGNSTLDKTIGTTIGNVLISLMVPAVRKVQVAYDRTEQVQRNLQVAFALAAFHAEHGRYPAQLDELTTRQRQPLPGDIFSGKALIYKPTASGYLLYSVGPNGNDDGGRSFDDDPPGDDLVVRMPQAALNPKK